MTASATSSSARSPYEPSSFRSPGSAYPPPPPPPHPHVRINTNGPIRPQASESPIAVSSGSPSANRQYLLSHSPIGAAVATTASPSYRGTVPSPLYAQASGRSSPMAMRAASGGGPVVEYNPQQWGAGGPTGGAYIPHTTLAVTAPPPANPENGDPNPPPPYSPPHTQSTHPHASLTTSPSGRPELPYIQTTMGSQPAAYASPMSAVPMSTIAMSPSPHSALVAAPRSNNMRSVLGSNLNHNASGGATNFPPPPVSARDRSTSRSRFGLSALARGLSTDRSGLSSTPEPQLMHPAQRIMSGGDGNQPFARLQRPPNNTAGNRMSVFVAPTDPIRPTPTRRSASAGPSAPVGATPPPGNIPPPPPGPPPSSSRATSMNRQGDEHVAPVSSLVVPHINLPTRQRGNNLTAPRLETIPHTPAGWTEDGQPIRPPNVSTSAVPMHESPISDNTSIASGSEEDRITRRERLEQDFRLERRDTTVKPIRERRSESRARMDPGRDRSTSRLDNSKPIDLTLNLANSAIGRQGALKRPKASISPRNPPPLPSSAGPSSRRGTLSNLSAPNSAKDKGPISNRDSSDSYQFTRHASRPGSSAGPMLGQETFAKESLDRHQAFIEKERLAGSDRERLDLFAEYIVAESRLRRDKYAAAFSAISGGDILDLTRDLWRPIQPRSAAMQNGKAPMLATSNLSTSNLSRPVSARTGSYDSHDSGSSPMSASRTNFTPRTESESPSSAGIPATAKDMFKGIGGFQPVLSPIPSMAMSTTTGGGKLAEDAPRGRSQSRWWESDTSSFGAGGRKIERSARESKYMGLHPDARYNLQYTDDQPLSAAASTPGRAGPSNEYPPEKVGWHEEEHVHQEPLFTPHYSVPNTPSATMGLDVSRLITLPPAYPRHYPANDMSHPELATIRSTIRKLNELDEIAERKAAYEAKVSRMRAMATQEAAARQTQMRQNISEQVQLGQMTYASAAAAEDGFNSREQSHRQAALRKEYDAYEPEVASPLNALLSERVTKASACISSLKEGLDDSQGSRNPDAPMEEGDEHPELLEKLKLIKWLAEAREILCRELFLIESERCDKYCDFIIADIEGRSSQGGPPDAKVQEATEFFRRDKTQRRITYEKEARGRAEDLVGIIETHVARGAQSQLSAFWDIAPGLAEILKKIPQSEQRLGQFRISIPHQEIEENPSFEYYPLQYLFGLLCHAEKATYQFIENQVGLWCLLQEVSLFVMRAGLRVVKAERCLEEGRDEHDGELESEMFALGSFEEGRLTRELKDRVDTVEGQWKEGLGSEIQGVVERVEMCLRDVGGWDDTLKE